MTMTEIKTQALEALIGLAEAQINDNYDHTFSPCLACLPLLSRVVLYF